MGREKNNSKNSVKVKRLYPCALSLMQRSKSQPGVTNTGRNIDFRSPVERILAEITLRTRQIMQYRTTATLRRPQIKQYTA